MQGTAAPGLPLGRAGQHWACSRRNEPVIQSVVLPAWSVSRRVWAVAGVVARRRGRRMLGFMYGKERVIAPAAAAGIGRIGF